MPQTYVDHHYQQYPQRQHDDRRQPVVGPPQGGWAGQLQATKWPKQCERRKQVCGLRRAAADVNSLARLEQMNRVGELDLR